MPTLPALPSPLPVLCRTSSMLEIAPRLLSGSSVLSPMAGCEKGRSVAFDCQSHEKTQGHVKLGVSQCVCGCMVFVACVGWLKPNRLQFNGVHAHILWAATDVGIHNVQAVSLCILIIFAIKCRFWSQILAIKCRHSGSPVRGS